MYLKIRDLHVIKTLCSLTLCEKLPFRSGLNIQRWTTCLTAISFNIENFYNILFSIDKMTK